jgi:hypothetical protein
MSNRASVKGPSIRRPGSDASDDDAFVAGAIEVSSWAETHRTTLIAVVVAIAVAVVGGLYWISSRAAADAGTLLRLRFETLAEYLGALRAAALALAPAGPAAAFYLAAAVSDFYLPAAGLAEHKIQSTDVGGAGLTLTLARVPKMLRALRAAWAPAAFVVGFKLETDPGILVAKATRSIDAYGLHAVVANVLDTRKDVVLLVTPVAAAPAAAAQGGGGGGGQGGSGRGTSGVAVETIVRPPAEPFIERALVWRVVALHRAYMEAEGRAGA